MLKKAFLFLPILFFQLSQCFGQQAMPDSVVSLPILSWEMEINDVHTCFKSDRLNGFLEQAWKKDTMFQKAGFYYARNIRLTDEEFASLTSLEKFIYAHEHPEDYLQSCSWYEIAKDMSHIYACIPTGGEGMHRSERQMKSLEDDREFTISSLTQCINFNCAIQLGYKRTILDLNIWEFIPQILETEARINKRDTNALKDPYVYSLLLELMNNNNFAELKKQGYYKTLYGPNALYKARIKYTPAVRKQIVDMASRFYNWKCLQKK